MSDKPKVPRVDEDPIRWRNQLLLYLDRKAAASSDASASTVSIAGSDADATYSANEQTLINELKADVNQLVTDLNAAVTALNDLKAKLRTANLLSA